MALQLTERIYSNYDSFGTSSRKIADFLLHNLATSNHRSIQALADQIDTSVSTISRFAKRLGYASYPELQLAISQQLQQPENLSADIDRTDPDILVAQKVFNSNSSSLNKTLDLLSESKLTNAVSLIQKCQRLSFFGLGASDVVALDAYHKFLRTQVNAVFNTDYHMALMQAAKMDEYDCAIVISHSGRNLDTLKMAHILKDNHVPIIVITSFSSSELAKLGDTTFYSVSDDSKYRSQALSSLISQMSIIDCLYMSVMRDEAANGSTKLDKINSVIKRTRE
ncbi:gluconate operon transcriptional regulator [Paucilactobacillus hokkaidonensis JCM 18461]|uniref:Gluconate operon transcriptional regulator n=2 Tax=Paucilactobacillus hokkaidonensis TaxID=1193095 RepID=A0A0A1H004_9LACO|nr:MurR/RpiR family transcriptional regulator [Paucilactobacillus hokkaidonensis]KRO08180.1 gluconate operon transcriptional regulator [Paucilactobacillus hokkaidonensis]BAP86579.1 gluconate operon transcriptional regulator [Paucilactobacillus hokkaidonensis JCM 18461]